MNEIFNKRKKILVFLILLALNLISCSNSIKNTDFKAEDVINGNWKVYKYVPAKEDSIDISEFELVSFSYYPSQSLNCLSYIIIKRIGGMNIGFTEELSPNNDYTYGYCKDRTFIYVTGFVERELYFDTENSFTIKSKYKGEKI